MANDVESGSMAEIAAILHQYYKRGVVYCWIYPDSKQQHIRLVSICDIKHKIYIILSLLKGVLRVGVGQLS